jgi:hypothetical protein
MRKVDFEAGSHKSGNNLLQVKIKDLEITNSSLLNINASLEKKLSAKDKHIKKLEMLLIR